MPKRAQSSTEVHGKVAAEMPNDVNRQTGFVEERKALRRAENGSGGTRRGGKKGKRTRPEIMIPESQNGDLDKYETLSLVCAYFAAGKLPGEIKTELAENHGVEFTREAIYKLLAYAAKNNMIRFQPHSHFVLRETLRHRYSWLQDVSVVRSISTVDIARATAAELLVLVKRRAAALAARGEPSVVRIGLAGGVAMRYIASELSDLLTEPKPDLPVEIALHALVAGFDPTDPLTDPNSFFAFFHRPDLAVDVSFVGFYGPALADGRTISGMEHLESVSAPQEAAKGIHIIVTSGGDWSDEHSILYKSLHGAGKVNAELTRRGCVGDILWHPIGKRGPIELEDDHLHAFTAIRLAELPALIADGRDVLLMMGPCVSCGEPKAKLLKTVLDLDKHYVSHVVVDSRTATRVAKSLA